MSKYDIGVGEAFELDEGQPQEDCGAHRGRHHRHHHHHGHHHGHHDDHHGPDHRHGRHAHDHHGHHHAHLAALAMLFALNAYRQHRRSHAEDRDFS